MCKFRAENILDVRRGGKFASASNGVGWASPDGPPVE